MHLPIGLTSSYYNTYPSSYLPLPLPLHPPLFRCRPDHRLLAAPANAGTGEGNKEEAMPSPRPARFSLHPFDRG
eukprot:765714-Hanusia_phi.AAC.4